MHRHRAAIAGDDLLSHAVDVFCATFAERLEDPQAVQAELEKLFILHTGGFYRLDDARFERIVEALVSLHGDRPEVAAGYARFSPENERCAAVLRRHDVRRRVDESNGLTIDATTPPSLDGRMSLFRSQQELAFFLAAREVFPMYFVYPNVALSAMIDFESIRDALGADERTYFFRAVIDCVVFDQHDDYRPIFFFELDSTLHDTEARHANDDRKDRILSGAGQTLYRIRGRETGHDAFARLLREVVSGLPERRS